MMKRMVEAWRRKTIELLGCWRKLVPLERATSSAIASRDRSVSSSVISPRTVRSIPLPNSRRRIPHSVPTRGHSFGPSRRLWGRCRGYGKRLPLRPDPATLLIPVGPGDGVVVGCYSTLESRPRGILVKDMVRRCWNECGVGCGVVLEPSWGSTWTSCTARPVVAIAPLAKQTDFRLVARHRNRCSDAQFWGCRRESIFRRERV